MSNEYLDMTGSESESNDFEPVKDGKYEFEIESAKETSIPTTGTPKLNIVYVVREDVEQDFQGRKVFEDWFKRKATGDYDKTRMRQLVKATGRATPDQKFSTLQDVLSFLIGKQVIGVVKNEDDSWNGKARTRTNIKYWEESQHKPEIGITDPTQIDPDDKDLPF